MTVNIGRMFQNRAFLSPDLEGYVGNGYRYTFSQANSRANQFSAYLKTNDISSGDRVAVLGKILKRVLREMTS